MKNDQVRIEITQKIAEAVKQGCAPWRRPWGNNPEKTKLCVPMTLPKNFLTGHRYSGVNPLLIMLACDTHGFASPYWGSMNQWSQIGAYVQPRPHHVPEGHWGTSIVFYTQIEKKRETQDTPAIPTEDGDVDKIMIMRRYTIFNADQVVPPNVDMMLKAKPDVQVKLAKKILGETIKKMTPHIAEQIRTKVEQRLSAYKTKEVAPPAVSEDYAIAANFLTATGARIKHGGNRAFYKGRPADYIQLPPAEAFDDLSAYYETAYHELCHWAEDGKRVGQSPKHKGKKGDGYAFSELVAEIGACFLAAETGLPIHQSMLPRSQSYVEYWLGQMGSDPKFIFEAATQSGKVVDYLLQLQGQQPCQSPATTGQSKNSSHCAVA